SASGRADRRRREGDARDGGELGGRSRGRRAERHDDRRRHGDPDRDPAGGRAAPGRHRRHGARLRASDRGGAGRVPRRGRPGLGGAAGDSPPGRWLPPIREFAPYPTTAFSVAVAPNGVAVVLRANVDAVSTTTKLGGGSWEKGTPFPDDLISPSIAVDDRGNALVTGSTLNEPADAPNSTAVAF